MSVKKKSTALRDGDLATRQGLYRVAAGHYRAALADDGGNMDLVQRLCYVLVLYAPEEALSFLEEFLAAPMGPTRQTQALRLLVPIKEAQLLRAAGRCTTNAADASGLGFHFVQPEIARWHTLMCAALEQMPSSPGALNLMTQSLLAMGRPLDAEPYFRDIRALGENTLPAATFLDAAFHAGLDDAAHRTLGTLPPCVVAQNAHEGLSKAIFFGCDLRYAEKYAFTMLASIAHHMSPDILVRLHIFDATDDDAKAFVARVQSFNIHLSVTREWTGLGSRTGAPTSDAARAYYHAIRYLRFLEFLDRYPDLSAWMLDIDLFFNRSPACLFDLLHGRDLALQFAPARLEFNNQIFASSVGVGASRGGRDYLRRVAGYLARCFDQRRLPWGVDQLALYAVYLEMSARSAGPDTVAIPPHIVDGAIGEDVALWPSKYAPDGHDQERYAAKRAALGLPLPGGRDAPADFVSLSCN